jgi:Flp pilus assembly protein TadG
MRRRNQRGQELVEFALIIALVLIFLFGIIDWGIAFLNHETIAQRTAWAARYYSTTSDAGGAQNIVLSGSPGGGGFTPLGMAGATITVQEVSSADPGGFTGSGATRDHVRVAVTNYNYPMFTPFIGQLINSAPITAFHPMEE